MKNSLITKESVTFIFIIGLLVLISTSILTYMNTKDQMEAKNSVTGGYYRIGILEEINSILADLDDFTDTDRMRLDSLVKQLNISLYSQGREGSADTLKSLISARLAMLSDSQKLKDKSGSKQKGYQIILEKEKVLNLDIRSQINRMKDAENDNMAEKTEMSEKSYKFASFTFIIGTAISCLIFIGVFLLLKKSAKEIFAADTGEITREELELIVKERTAEISEINRKLYQKIELLEKTEEALKSSEQYYRMLFEQAHDAIIIFSADDGEILDLNNHACEIYGFSRNEFIGLTLKSISKNYPSAHEHIQQTLKKGYNYNFQIVHYKKDSTEMLIEVNATVIRYNNKPAILSINRDITDRILKVV